MSSTLFAVVTIFAPVHALIRRLLAGNRGRSRCAHATPAAQILYPLPGAQGNSQPVVRDTVVPRRARVTPALRVLRVIDAGPSAPHGGRMLISGRMADVCAELDRLAALEAALQPGA